MNRLITQGGYVQSVALLLGLLFFMGLTQSQLRALWQVDLQQMKRARLTKLNYLYTAHFQYIRTHPTTKDMGDNSVIINANGWPKPFTHTTGRIELVQNRPDTVPLNAIVITRCTDDGMHQQSPCSEWRYVLEDDNSSQLQYRVDYRR